MLSIVSPLRRIHEINVKDFGNVPSGMPGHRSSIVSTAWQPLEGLFLIYNSAIYALQFWLSRTVCASKNTSPSLFINKTSTAIDNFMAMNPCGSGQKKPSRGLERRATQRVLKDWRGRSMFQPMTGMHLNVECSLGWRSREVARRSCRRQFQPQACIVGTDLERT